MIFMETNHLNDIVLNEKSKSENDFYICYIIIKSYYNKNYGGLVETDQYHNILILQNEQSKQITIENILMHYDKCAKSNIDKEQLIKHIHFKSIKTKEELSELIDEINKNDYKIVIFDNYINKEHYEYIIKNKNRNYIVIATQKIK